MIKDSVTVLQCYDKTNKKELYEYFLRELLRTVLQKGGEEGRRDKFFIEVFGDFILENLKSFVITKGKEVKYYPESFPFGVLDLQERELFLFSRVFFEFCRKRGYKVFSVKKFLFEWGVLKPYVYRSDKIEWRMPKRFKVLGKRLYSVYRLDLKELWVRGRNLVEIVELMLEDRKC